MTRVILSHKSSLSLGLNQDMNQSSASPHFYHFYHFYTFVILSHFTYSYTIIIKYILQTLNCMDYIFVSVTLSYDEILISTREHDFLKQKGDASEATQYHVTILIFNLISVVFFLVSLSSLINCY